MAIDLTIKNRKKPDVDFQRIASELMNKWVIKVESKKYRIAEIEFYFKGEDHLDSYTHGHKLQREKGQWYFHGSGIDLTFGSEGYYGGILIRALQELPEGKYFYGPLNCVAEIFNNLGSVYEKSFTMGIVKAENGLFEKEEPIAATRVGLNPDKDSVMYEAFYRYLIMPNCKHAEKTKIYEGMRKQGYSDEHMNSIWG